MPDARTSVAAVHGPSDLVVRDLHVRAVRTEAREADFICSTDAVDSYGEVVDQTWNLTRYLKNPVVLWAHQSRELPIGQAKNVGVVDGKLQATIVFSKAHQRAEEAWKCVAEGTVRAVSVGFMPNDIRLEKRDGEELLVLANNDLYEISVTPIPANPECLGKMRARAVATNTHNPPVVDTNGTDGESLMADEKTKAADDKLAATEKQLSDERAKVAVLDERVKTLEAERSALQKSRDDLATRMVEREVDELVGIKIAPAEKAGLVKMATRMPDEWPAHLSALKARADLPSAKSVAGGGSVVGPDPAPTTERTAAPDDNGAALEAAIQKDLAAQAS